MSDGLAESVADVVAITVQDLNDPPLCSLAKPTVGSAWPPNHKMFAVAIQGVTDPNGERVTLTVTGVTQDEPVNGPDDGDTSPDAVVQDAGVLLRAERAGTGNGRVYVIYFEADDGNGGTCTGSVSVSVPLDRKRAAVDSGQDYESLEQ